MKTREELLQENARLKDLLSEVERQFREIEHPNHMMETIQNVMRILKRGRVESKDFYEFAITTEDYAGGGEWEDERALSGEESGRIWWHWKRALIDQDGQSYLRVRFLSLNDLFLFCKQNDVSRIDFDPKKKLSVIRLKRNKHPESEPDYDEGYYDYLP